MKKTSTGGFTLIEVLVVVVIVGVLASIAAPGWLTFINRQRANAVRDEILQVLQTAQSDARRTNKNYKVEINSTIGAASITTGPNAATFSGIQTELGDSQIRSKLKVEAIDSTPATPVSVNEFVFTHDGKVDEAGQLPLVIFTSLDGTNLPKRCVVITTPLGSMVTAEGDTCDAPNYVPIP